MGVTHIAAGRGMQHTGHGADIAPRAELFAHDADVGVRGIGPTLESAFEQTGLALTMAVTDPAGVRPTQAVEVACTAPDSRFLLVDWLNALIYEMSTHRLVFARFDVSIASGELHGRAWGEPVDPLRHKPATEPKGATLTALRVSPRAEGGWVAQCIVDV